MFNSYIQIKRQIMYTESDKKDFSDHLYFVEYYLMQWFAKNLGSLVAFTPALSRWVHRCNNVWLKSVLNDVELK